MKKASIRPNPGIRRMLAWITLLWLAVPSWTVFGAETSLPVMRISLENAERHVQALSVKRFADDLSQRLAGRLDVQLHLGARMFRDRDVIAALAQGKVEMAVPGAWQIDRFEPNVGIFQLPAFYGRSSALSHRLTDGPVGKIIHGHIEQSLGVHVLGRWIDLGYAHLYGVNKAISRHEDIAGMRIRVAGGVANAMRIEGLGGIPRVVAWPDLRTRMAQGVIDGILTTHESVVSDRLWEAGVRSAFEDREYFPQYVPLVSQTFWQRLSPDMQEIIGKTWEDHVDEARKAAEEAQFKARQTLAEQGVEIVTPPRTVLDKWRQRLMKSQDELIRSMRIDSGLFSQVQKEIAEGRD